VDVGGGGQAAHTPGPGLAHETEARPASCTLRAAACVACDAAGATPVLAEVMCAISEDDDGGGGAGGDGAGSAILLQRAARTPRQQRGREGTPLLSRLSDFYSQFSSGIPAAGCGQREAALPRGPREGTIHLRNGQALLWDGKHGC
jgi:hypothetical protein